MSRLIVARVGTWVLAGGMLLLESGGCRFGYELTAEGVPGAAGAAGGDSPVDDAHAGGGAGGVDDGGASVGASGGAASGGAASGGAAGGEAAGGVAGEGGQSSSLAGVGGMAAGGESTQGSLPPLPCAEPLVWSTDFSSDPTMLDDNGDGQPDWVIRSGEAFVAAELTSGVWRPTTSKALDTFPAVNFTGRTQARVRMRDTNQTAPSTPSSYGGALFWINLDYKPSGFLAVYSSITTRDGAAYELGIFAQANGTTDTLAGPHGVANDAFTLLELDFDPATGAVAAWLDGTPLPATLPNRQTNPNLDQFATAIAPQGTGEFDELWVATCKP